MNSTNLNQVVSPLGALAGLMPARHVGQRIGMPSTVKRPFSPRGLQALPVHPSLSGHPPRGGFSPLHLASGGQADFETIALDAARHGHARDAIGDFLSSRMADGGAARFDPWRQRGQLRGRLKEGEDQDGSKLLASLLGLDDPSSMGSMMKPKSMAAMWAGIPSSAAGMSATLGLHSENAGAPELMEYMQAHPEYARALANYMQQGQTEPQKGMQFGDFPRSLQQRISTGNTPGWAR